MGDRRRPGRGRDRGVSSTLGYVLTLSISVILISGLLFSVGTFVTGQNERVTESELAVLGQRLAADIEAADRLAEAADGDARVVVTSRLPRRVAGRPYRVAINESGADELVLSTIDPDVSVTVRVVTDYSLANATVGGGTVDVAFDGTRLEVASA